VIAGDGTKTLTVAFDDRVNESVVARGFVDAGTVARPDVQSPPVNPKQAEAVSNDGNTANPDVVSIATSGENALLFEFDENISEFGDTSGFNFYDSDGTETDAQNLERTDDPRVISVRFEPQANASTNAVGGSVDANAVIGPETTREDGDVNQPDEDTLPTAPINNTTATDPDGDGLFEDVDGDEQLTRADAQVLYNNLDDPAIRNDPSAFDFNGDGEVTQADAQALYAEWSDSG
jgi:hypothetical protein